jgi:DNA replication protein DnaC
MSETTADEYKTETFVCPIHGEYAGETTHYVWPPEDVPPPCPVCRREAREEKRREETIKKWRSMNIDERYYKAAFDTFNAYNDELKRHLETCRAFAENPDGKLVMIGTNGSGKTHLAVSVLKELGGVIYTAFEIGVNLRQSYNGGTKEHEVYDELCSVPLLVIDEVEKIKDSESKQNWMSYVIGKRYNRMLPLIIIANCHTQKDCTEQKKPCPHCLEYHLESDVISRITEDGRIMKFSGGDYRKKIRNERFSRRRGDEQK